MNCEHPVKAIDRLSTGYQVGHIETEVVCVLCGVHLTIVVNLAQISAVEDQTPTGRVDIGLVYTRGTSVWDTLMERKNKAKTFYGEV